MTKTVPTQKEIDFWLDEHKSNVKLRYHLTLVGAGYLGMCRHDYYTLDWLAYQSMFKFNLDAMCPILDLVDVMAICVEVEDTFRKQKYYTRTEQPFIL